jgi:arylsulfatase
MIFFADDGCDVGEDTGSPVSEDYRALADAAESSDHFVSPEDAVRIAMARR